MTRGNLCCCLRGIRQLAGEKLSLISLWLLQPFCSNLTLKKIYLATELWHQPFRAARKRVKHLHHDTLYHPNLWSMYLASTVLPRLPFWALMRGSYQGSSDWFFPWACKEPFLDLKISACGESCYFKDMNKWGYKSKLVIIDRLSFFTLHRVH